MRRCLTITASGLLALVAAHPAFGATAPEFSARLLDLPAAFPLMLWAAFFLPCFRWGASTLNWDFLIARS